MQIIDLTYTIEEGMTTFNSYWHPFVEINQIGRHGHEGRETRKVSIGTHTGTHIDAPLHFVKDGLSVDKISLEDLWGDVEIIDFRYLTKGSCITESMLKNEKLGKKVIFNFGWGKYWGSKDFYNDYPYFDIKAAEYLVNNGVKLIGIDTPSPDDSKIILDKDSLGSDKDSPIHKIFLENGVLLVEYLANLDKVKDCNNWKIAVMPLKIKNADGAPARVCLWR